jgi:hypothetical protein
VVTGVVRRSSHLSGRAFELLDALRHGGLRHVQASRGRLEGALVDDRAQGVQLVECEAGHETSLCSIENMSWCDAPGRP